MASKLLRDEGNLNLVKKVATGNLAFAIDLYRLTTARDNENVFFSPASINIALAMTRVGARSETLKQLTKALNLHLVDKEEDVHTAYNLLNETFNIENEQLMLRTANRMYVQKSFELLKEFTESLKRNFKTEVGIVDFVKDAPKTAEEINQWVEGVTNQKIKNLIDASMLNAATRLVLVNAVYFKGTWKLQFEEADTEPMDFHLSSSKNVKIDMMSQKEDFQYAESADLDCKILQLPYDMSSLRMLILLPNQVEGLQQLTTKISTENFKKVISTVRKEKVNVKLPKFKLETTYELTDLLRELGVTHMFSPGESDLSGITGKKDLCVSAVVHKTFLDVNEKGTEAAAATAVMMMLCCAMMPEAPRPEKEFIADHPFLFLIQDCHTELVLFMGCFRNPK